MRDEWNELKERVNGILDVLFHSLYEYEILNYYLFNFMHYLPIPPSLKNSEA